MTFDYSMLSNSQEFSVSRNFNFNFSFKILKTAEQVSGGFLLFN